MFTLPMLCAMVLPNIPPRSGVFFEIMPTYLAQVFRPISPLIVWLLPFGLVLVCSLLVSTLFVPSLRPNRLVPFRVLLRRGASVFLPVLVPLLLLGTSVASFALAAQCVGGSWYS
jgi:hypothetical protein